MTVGHEFALLLIFKLASEGETKGIASPKPRKINNRPTVQTNIGNAEFFEIPDDT